MAKKTIRDLLVNLRIADVRPICTDQGGVLVIDFESMTSDILGASLTIPAEVADQYDLSEGWEEHT